MDRSAVAQRHVEEDVGVVTDVARIGFASDAEDPSFAGHLREVRKCRAGKQVCLSFHIGCTDAALSLWESGARLPSQRSLRQILLALAQLGATTAELLTIRGAWFSETRRRSMNRVRPSSVNDVQS